MESIKKEIKFHMISYRIIWLLKIQRITKEIKVQKIRIIKDLLEGNNKEN
jgi:hypothetical protein